MKLFLLHVLIMALVLFWVKVIVMMVREYWWRFQCWRSHRKQDMERYHLCHKCLSVRVNIEDPYCSECLVEVLSNKKEFELDYDGE